MGMAVRTACINRFLKQPYIVGRMGFMADHAHACVYRRMVDSVHKFLFHMTVETEIRHTFAKKPFLVRLVRFMAAGACSACNGGMLQFLAVKVALAVASETDARQHFCEQLYFRRGMSLMA